MSDKELEELRDIKKLLVLLLIASKVKQGEISEILEMDQGNFSKAYPTSRLLKRMRAEGGLEARKKKTKTLSRD